MRVLLVSADFPPVRSGEANHAFYLAHHLSRRGLDVQVLTTAIDGVHGDDSFAVHPVMKNWSWLDLPKLSSIIKGCAPDVVLLIFLGAMYRHHPMVTFAATVARRIRPSVRFVTQFENVGVRTWEAPIWTRLGRRLMVHWARGGGMDYQYGTLLRDSHRLIVLSEAHRAHLAAHSPEINEKHVLIPPAPIMKFCHDGCQRRPDTRAALGVAKEEFLLIYYGYIYPGKGMETLIAAMHLLKQRAVPVRLLVVGGYGDHVGSADDQAQRQAYGQQIEELPERLGIAHEVIWTGPCPSDDERASALLYAADACVLPFDGGVHLNNSSFAAAAAHGLPIVTTRSATTEPAFRDGETAILCSPKDPGALAAAIQALVRQPALQRRMRDGARAMAAQWFCWEAAAQRTIETFA